MKTMTQSSLFQAVRALGIAITVNDGEYRVTYRVQDEPCPGRREDQAYYVDDREEALAAAQWLRHWKDTKTSLPEAAAKLRH